MSQRNTNFKSVIGRLCPLVIVVILMVGCTNGSPASFSTSSLFAKPEESLSAADLKTDPSYSKSTQWFESYENAQRESLRTGKPMLALFTGSDWCGPCISLKKHVFESSAFKKWAADEVVLLKLDFPKKTPQSPKLKTQNQRLSQKYAINSYPTILFLDSDGEVQGKQGHGTDAVQWIAAAERKLR